MKSDVGREIARTHAALGARARAASLALALAAVALIGLNAANAAESKAAAPAQPQPAVPASDGKYQRNFYEVLEDLMSDFEYDLKNGAVVGLKDLAIRNMALSENVPPSFRNHLELVVTERILKNSKTKVIQCLPCRAKRTTLNGDQVVITSAETNPVELSRIAKISGISHFMDVAYSYQSNGMVLSMYITDPDSGSIVWSRSYNSETSRASAFRRGVDYSQIDDARKQQEYQPTIQYRLTAYYMSERNIAATTGCIGIGFRMMERYDNRRKEVGFELDFLKDSSSIVSGASTGTTESLWGGLNLTLLFMHAWNLIGGEENFNAVRGNLFVGVGGTYASGFLGGLVRAGYEWRLAKHWAVSANLGYRPQATAFVGASSTGTAVSGAEFGLGINYLF